MRKPVIVKNRIVGGMSEFDERLEGCRVSKVLASSRYEALANYSHAELYVSAGGRFGATETELDWCVRCKPGLDSSEQN